MNKTPHLPKKFINNVYSSHIKLQKSNLKLFKSLLQLFSIHQQAPERKNLNNKIPIQYDLT